VGPRARRNRATGVRLALAAAGGFLVGVLLVLALGGGTTTKTKTVTAPAAQTHGGTVIVTTTVPELVDQSLDVARQRAERAKFDLVIDHGGGLFGVLVEHNWQVSSQTPAAGTKLEQGSTVHVDIERR
jgi:beta-lactam-binding protein with PASTA domain